MSAHANNWNAGEPAVEAPPVDRLRNAIARRYLAARLAEDECMRAYAELSAREKAEGVHHWDEGIRLLKMRNRSWFRGRHLMRAVSPFVDASHGAFRDPIILGCEGWPASAVERLVA